MREAEDGQEKTRRAEEVLFHARRGDKAAFAALNELYRKPVTRFVYRLIGNAEADDVISETFLALHLNLGRLAKPDDVLPFLYRVARNRAYDTLRKQGRFEIVALNDDSESGGWAARLPSPDPTPDRVLERLALWSELQTAVDQLPENQRQTLILYAEEGISYAQIAEILGVDIVIVRSRLFQARRNLTRRLRPDTLAAFGVPADTKLADTRKEK